MATSTLQQDRIATGKTAMREASEKHRKPAKAHTFTGFLTLQETAPDGFTFQSESRPNLRHEASLVTGRCSCESHRLLRCKGKGEECFHLQSLRLIDDWAGMKPADLLQIVGRHMGGALHNLAWAAIRLKRARWEREGKNVSLDFLDALFQVRFGTPDPLNPSPVARTGGEGRWAA
jgi:hypothetical protein